MQLISNVLLGAMFVFVGYSHADSGKSSGDSQHKNLASDAAGEIQREEYQNNRHGH